VATFATDLGEYIWWKSVRGAVAQSTEVGVVTLAEARRAMAFVLTWVVCWEAFSATYTADRLGRRWMLGPPPSSLPEGYPVLLAEPAKVGAAPRRRFPDGSLGPQQFALMVPFACGSEEHPWDTWKAHLYQAVTGPGPSWSFAFIHDDGVLEFFVDPEVDVTPLSRAVAETFAAAASLRAQAAADAAALDDFIAKRAEPVRKALVECRTPLNEPLFTEVSVRRYATGTSRDKERAVHTCVEAEFCVPYRRAALERVTGPEPRSELIPGEGTLNGMGVSFRGDVEISDALEFVQRCVDDLSIRVVQCAAEEADLEDARRNLERRVDEPGACPPLPAFSEPVSPSR
jgi:hypothetical protein